MKTENDVLRDELIEKVQVLMRICRDTCGFINEFKNLVKGEYFKEISEAPCFYRAITQAFTLSIYVNISKLYEPKYNKDKKTLRPATPFSIRYLINDPDKKVENLCGNSVGIGRYQKMLAKFECTIVKANNMRNKLMAHTDEGAILSQSEVESQNKLLFDEAQKLISFSYGFLHQLVDSLDMSRDAGFQVEETFSLIPTNHNDINTLLDKVRQYNNLGSEVPHVLHQS